MDRDVIRTIINAIKASDAKKTQAYDTTATVRRVEDGTAWVHIPGGVDETPVKLTVDAKQGDTVQVRVSGGTAFIVGNASAPPTDDTTAVKVGTRLTATQKILRAVKSTAEKAAKIASDTNQYFWFTSTGSDTGAHITEIPQDEFLADPDNGGGNLLARSNGIAVRNGTNELATFSSSGVFIGDSEEAYADLSSDGIKFGLEGEERVRWQFEGTGQTSVIAKEVFMTEVDETYEEETDSSGNTYNYGSGVNGLACLVEDAGGGTETEGQIIIHGYYDDQSVVDIARSEIRITTAVGSNSEAAIDLISERKISTGAKTATVKVIGDLPEISATAYTGSIMTNGSFSIGNTAHINVKIGSVTFSANSTVILFTLGSRGIPNTERSLAAIDNSTGQSYECWVRASSGQVVINTRSNSLSSGQIRVVGSYNLG